MNSNKFETRLIAARKTFRKVATKVGAGATALMVSGAALAQATDPGGAITAEITAGKTTVTAILVVLAGVLGLFLLWSMIKRAK